MPLQRSLLPLSAVQWLAPEKLRGCGAILLNSSGQRFVDELTTRDKVTEAIMKQVCCQASRPWPVLMGCRHALRCCGAGVGGGVFGVCYETCQGCCC